MPGAESLLSQHVTGFGSPGHCEAHPLLRRHLYSTGFREKSRTAEASAFSEGANEEWAEKVL